MDNRIRMWLTIF